MSFRDTEDLDKTRKVNKEEATATRQVPERGIFKEFEAGAGNKTFKMDRRGIWMGNVDFDIAPFSLSMEGLFKLLSTAGGGGAVGFSADKGLWVGAEEFEDAPFSVDPNGVFKIKAKGDSGKFIGIDAQKGIWLGAEEFEDAPFRVDTSGSVKFKATAGAEDLSLEWEDEEGNLSIYLGFEEV